MTLSTSGKHFAVYSRVSSRTQDTAAQDGDLTAWTERAALPCKWYRDKFTGRTMDRPGFNALLEAIARNEVEAVVIWRLDRLGRTAAGLAKLFEDLQSAKVNLVSLRDSLDLSTPAGRLMANVLASVAAYETEIRKERQIAGIDAARAAGKRWGGSEKGRRLKVTPEQITTAKQLRSGGARVAAIARAVGLSRPTVRGILKTEFR